MVEPKVSLIMSIPGSDMVSQQEAENNPKELTEVNTLKFKNYDKKLKNLKIETLTFRTRKNVTVKQVIKMSKEAYEEMLNTPISNLYTKVIGKSKGKNIRIWDTLSKETRVRKHCEIIAHDFNALDFDFQILED